MRINEQNKSIDMEVRDINFFLPPYVKNYLFYNKNEMPKKIIFPMFASVRVDGVEIPIDYISPQDPVALEIADDGADIVEVSPAQEAALDEKDEEIKNLKAEVESLLQTEREVGGTEEQSDDMGGTQLPEPEIAEENIGGPEEGIVEEVYEVEPTSEQLLDEAADVQLEKDTALSPARAAFAESPEPTPKADPMPSDRQPKQPPRGDIGPGAGPSDMHARDQKDQARTQRDLLDEPPVDESEEKEFGKTVSRGEDGKPIVEDKDE